MRDIESVIKVLKADASYRRLSKTFSNESLFNIPFKAWHEEIENIHKTRIVRFLRPGEHRFIERLLESSTQDQANRSRLVEMRVHCIKVESELNKALKILEDHFLVNYHRDLASVKSTQTERARIVKTVLSKFQKFLHETALIKEMSAMVIEDIDKAGWSRRLDLDAFEVHNKPEATL